MSRILIADDEADMRGLLREILRESGHELHEASDGEEALSLVAAVHPDLLVLDLMMPNTDGFEVLKMMAVAGFAATKVLIVTAKTSENDWARGYALGADLYLTKPFDPEEFVDAVDKALTTSREDLRAQRDVEQGKAELLSQLETMFQGI